MNALWLFLAYWVGKMSGGASRARGAVILPGPLGTTSTVPPIPAASPRTPSGYGGGRGGAPAVDPTSGRGGAPGFENYGSRVPSGGDALYPVAKSHKRSAWRYADPPTPAQVKRAQELLPSLKIGASREELTEGILTRYTGESMGNGRRGVVARVRA